LHQRYEECAQRAKKCRELNDRNGLLVGAQIKRVEGLLGAMTGTSAEPRSYGPRGLANPYSSSAGKVISAEA
jgi:flagellar biosynthesis/type III secretory pathway chaperone